jgi:hypothetical protein
LEKDIRIAYFVSSHGLGHAARAAAVMESIRAIDPGITFDILTAAPEWFFKETLSDSFHYHHLQTDVGLKQRTPYHEDLTGTLSVLDTFFPFQSDKLASVVQTIKENACKLILCDISPMGIAAGQEAGIPSVLVENFTWDWIYEAYSASAPDFIPHIQFLKNLFAEADFHIQTEPVCAHGDADLTTLPVSRRPRLPASEVRSALGINGSKPVVHITMGGVPGKFSLDEKLKGYPDLTFIVSGASDALHRNGNVYMLPYHSTIYHPDIIHAADLVIGKAGYSTLAEVYYAGIPFMFVKRPTFRESAVISEFVRMHMHGKDITVEQFEAGGWVDDVPELLNNPVISRTEKTGADQVAEFINNLLSNHGEGL